MFIKSLQELKNLPQESLKDLAVANVAHVVEEGIREAIVESDKTWTEKLNAEKEAATAAQTKAQAAEAKVGELQGQISTLTTEVNNLKAAQQQAVANSKFNERMAFFDEKFNLDDTTRKAIASRIKGLDETAFTEVANNELGILLAPRSKQQAQASQQQQQQDPKAVAQAALNNATVTTAGVPNTTAGEKTLAEEMAAEFGGDNIKFSFTPRK